MEFDLNTIRLDDSRLLGIEIELDSGNTEFRRPVGLTGWHETDDGSLRNGYEYVMAATPFNRARPLIQDFDDKVTAARTNVESRGSMHVHVQAHDLTPEHALTLCHLYTRYQRDIDMLVAPSRRSDKRYVYCKPHPAELTLSQWKETFKWDSKASSREGAKRGDRYWTVNCQPMSVDRAASRSVEFRQGGPTRKAVNIYGWASLCVALVKISKLGGSVSDFQSPNLVALLRNSLPRSGVAEWVQWRTEYLNQPVTPELVEKAVEALNRYHGIHHVSRCLNIPLPVAKAVCMEGVRQNVLTADGAKFRRVGAATRSDADYTAENERLLACLRQ